MTEKDESVIRFSELIRKGTSKKESPEKEKEDPTAGREDAAFRMSDLDSLSVKGKPVTPAASKQGIPSPRSEREIERERREKLSEDIHLKDIHRTRASGGKDAPAGDDAALRRNSDLGGVWKTEPGRSAAQPTDRLHKDEPVYPADKNIAPPFSERRHGGGRRSGDIPLRGQGGSEAKKETTIQADTVVESERAAGQEELRLSQAARLQKDTTLSGEKETPRTMWGGLGLLKSAPEVKDKKTVETQDGMPEAVSPSPEGGMVAEQTPPDAKAVSTIKEAVETEVLPKPEEAIVPEQEEAAIGRAAEETDKIYMQAIRYLQGVKEKIVDGKPFEIETALALIAKMVESRDCIQNLGPVTMRTIQEDDYNISHQVNVMIYALKLGFGLKYPKEKLVELGLSALLHDVGMFRIPASISLKTGQLTGHEIDVIKTHPEIGRDILKPFSGRYAFLPEVAYEHHEREEGQGYPQGLRGNDIHEYAKILSLVDSYEAMTHNRPYRKALMQSFSAKELIKHKNALFAPFVIKVFLQEISLYPLGSYVVLNSKAVAEVVACDQKHPLRPDVKILFDGEGSKVYDNVIIKLSQNPLFFIVDGVSPDEIPKR